MDSRREELCSNLIYQSYQGKDSFCSSCLPGWDSWKVGGERNTSALKFWGLGTLGCKHQGEQVVISHTWALSAHAEWAHHRKCKRSACGGIMTGYMEDRVSCLTSPPCDPPPAQTTAKRRRKQLRVRPCELNKSRYLDYFLLLEHIYLVSERCSGEWNKVFCVTGWHPPHLPPSISSSYPQETQNQNCVLNGMKAAQKHTSAKKPWHHIKHSLSSKLGRENGDTTAGYKFWDALILQFFIRAKSNTRYRTGKVCFFFPTSFLAPI